MDTVSIIVSTVSFLAAIPMAWAGVYAHRLYGGLRKVLCPETMESAVVKIHAMRAIASRLAGGKAVPMRSCSRWPERRGCGQGCVAQVMATPGACRTLPRS